MAAISFFSFRTQPTRVLEFSQVQRQDIEASVSTSGVLAGKKTANLKFSQGGKLAFINITANDKVTAFQTIAGLDTQTMGISLQQAQNNLKDKQETLNKIINDIHLSQYGNGGFGNVGSANETETQKQLRTSAEVARDNAADSVRAAQRNLQDAYIIAPFDGIVTQTSLYPGQNAGPSDVIAQVVDNTSIYFDTDVDQADISKITLGQKAKITLDAYPDQTFDGTVDEISPVTKTTSTNATVVTVRILLTSQINFISGLTGQATIINSQSQNALTIPIDAIKTDNTVIIQTPEGLKATPVTVGIRSDSDAEITQGLKEGERVVTNPPATLPKKQAGVFNQVFRMFGRGGR